MPIRGRGEKRGLIPPAAPPIELARAEPRPLAWSKRVMNKSTAAVLDEVQDYLQSSVCDVFNTMFTVEAQPALRLIYRQGRMTDRRCGGIPR
jgi:hypothetical protein